MPTPLVYDGHLYLLRDNGVLAVYDAETGERRYRQRLGPGGSGFTASPVAADGKVYFTSEDGEVYVVRAGRVVSVGSRTGIERCTPESTVRIWAAMSSGPSRWWR